MFYQAGADSSYKPSVRIWCDGCYDFMHFGHANSFRQAKALGSYLVVGVHTDEEITRHKGPPVFSFEERCQMVKAVKWVDEVVKGAPYITSLEVMDQYGCDFCCHGEDITLTDEGLDSYHLIKEAGRYKQIQRTVGISTTALVDRILAVMEKNEKERLDRSPWTGSGRFLLTTQRIVEFSGGKPPQENDTVVYVVGAFDLFHIGHLEFLEKARSLGDYLIVGLYSDQLISRYKRDNYPIMTLHERLLVLLACKYVSDVVIDAPFAVSEEIMDNFKVNLVAGGYQPNEDKTVLGDPYSYPKSRNLFVQLKTQANFNTEKIIQRVINNRNKYEDRNRNKEKREIDFLTNR